MKELKDTIEMMNSADYKERFKAEYWQLKIRLDKLCDLLTQYRSGTLPFEPTCPVLLLHKQFDVMCEYFDYLRMRAQIEGIELEETNE